MFRALMVLALLASLQVASAATAGATAWTCAGVTATLRGTEAADVLVGTRGRDVIVGLGGADKISGRGGNDLICGGSGNDRIEAGRGRDRVLGGLGSDRLHGGMGNDRVDGEDGGDQVRGGDGDDVVRTGSLFPANGAPDYVFVDAGDDTLIGGHEAAVLHSGFATRGIVVNIPAGTVRGLGVDALVGRFFHVQGSDYDDLIVGGDLDEMIDGGLGRDVVKAGGGTDWLVGDSWSADQLYGQSGDDHLGVQVKGARAFGGDGADVVEISGGALGDGGEGDDVLLPRGGGSLSGGNGVDALLLYFATSRAHASLAAGTVSGGLAIQFDEVENLGGTNFADVLIGDDGANFMDGGPGQDVVRGGAGDDILVGQTGPDTFYGELGHDLCGPGTRYDCEGDATEPLF